MKTLFVATAILFTSISSLAETIYCKGQVDFYGEKQNFEVLIEGEGIGQAYVPSVVKKIEVSGASLPQTNVFNEAVDYWDGHGSGLITARGFAMTYDNEFDCIKNVVISTDFRGDVQKSGQTVGHIMRSEVIATCDNGNRLCSKK